MNDRDPDRAWAVREIATVLAIAYLRLRFPEPPLPVVDCSERVRGLVRPRLSHRQPESHA